MALMEWPATGLITPATGRDTMWHTFTPLEPANFAISPRACEVLAQPIGYRLTGEELIGCGLWPGDLLVVDVADRAPQPGALVVVWGCEDDPDPDPDVPPSVAALSPALRARIRPQRRIPIAGQYWPTPRTGGEIIEIRAVLPGFPAPLGILDCAFDDALIGVVHGYYGTSTVRGCGVATAVLERYDWSAWDFVKEIRAARGRMKAAGALMDWD